MKQNNNKGRLSSKAVNSAASIVLAVGLLGVPLATAFTVGSTKADATSSYVSLSSFSGHPDADIFVSGGNYVSGETVTITASQNGTKVAGSTAKANASGQFSGDIQLPAKLAQGSVTIMATGQTSGSVSTNSYYAVPFSPSLSTADGQTTPYSKVTVSGSGYAPNETVDLNLAGSIVTVHADAMGGFTGASLTTPVVPAASYTLVGAGEASGSSAVAYEYVNGFYPSASPSSYYVMPATSLGFTGSGFAPNEKVTVSDAISGTVVSGFTTDATGAFKNAGSFTVPGNYAGLTKKFVLTGSLSQATTTTSTVIGQYYPSVSPTKYYVLPGASVAFNGSGFVPGETVDITSGSTSYGSVVADAKGNLIAAGSVTTLSSQAGKTLSFSLYGETSHATGTVSTQVGSYSPQASPSGYYVLPGTVVTFGGSGYAPQEVVTVFNGQTNIGQFTTDTTGAFAAQGSSTVAYSQAGSSVKYTLIGAVSNQAINFTIGVGQLNTQLTPSSYYVLPYVPFSVTVTGFAPKEIVTLSTGATATTDAMGQATFKNISLPYNGKSSATLLATGTTSAATATASIGIGSYNTNVVASDYYAKPGTTDTLTGSGFVPGEIVTVAAGTVSQTVTADAKGGFTTSLVLPFAATTKNSLDIVSTGSLSNAPTTTSVTLAPYTPQIAPSTYYATPGTAITFTGSGFVPAEKISVSLNGTQVGSETADAKGNLTSVGSYTLPFGKTASYTVTGLTSGGTNTMVIGLAQFYAGLQFSDYYGNGGSVVTASGSGYAPNEKVALTSGTTTLATVTADKAGAFSTPITIPYAAPGKVTVTAKGATSQASAATSYTVAQVYNSVGLGSYAVPAGKAVSITGSGFLANEPVTVTSDRGGISYSFKADAKGNLKDSGLVLPASLAEGMLTLTFNGQYSFTSHDITLYVQSPNAQ